MTSIASHSNLLLLSPPLPEFAPVQRSSPVTEVDFFGESRAYCSHCDFGCEETRVAAAAITIPIEKNQSRRTCDSGRKESNAAVATKSLPIAFHQRHLLNFSSKQQGWWCVQRWWARPNLAHLISGLEEVSKKKNQRKKKLFQRCRLEEEKKNQRKKKKL